MKNTTKTIAAVLAVFLAAALFVGAASAADGYRNVANEDTAFVYEQINVTDGAKTLVMLDSNGNPLNILTGSASDGGYTYNLVESVVGSNYGRYYYNGDDGADAKYIDIWAPELVLKAELKDNQGTSVDGKTVTKNTEITFSLQAPHVGPASGQETQNINDAFDNIYATLDESADVITETSYKYIKENASYIDGNLTAVLTTTPTKNLEDSLSDYKQGLEKTTIANEVATFKESLDKTIVGNPNNVNYTKELYPVVHLTFTTPAGGKTTLFGDKSYAAAFLSKNVETVVGTSNAGDGAQAGLYTVQAEYIAPTLFDRYAKESNTVTFTVQSATVAISAAKDSVIRSNPITVTIQGEAKTSYYVYIQGCKKGQADAPALLGEQLGYQGEEPIGDTETAYVFETDASGQRTIEFTTNQSTDDKTYTIEVYEKYENDELTGDHDSVKVKVEKGAVTITASGDGSYYIGSEITLSGTNTDSDTVYLFITGPNLDSNGVQLLDLKESAANGGSPVSVKTDNTWEKTWDTSRTGLDTGAYTIYATSGSYGKNSLSKTEYATVSVSLKQPFLSAVPSGTIIAKGDDLYIRGTAEGEPNNLNIYIFGPNKFKDDSVNVEDDGTYEKKIKIDSDWASNQYFVVIQHPMYNGDFDAKLNKEDSGEMFFYIANAGNPATEQASFYVTGTNKLQGSNAADALTKMIDNANIDDIYTKLTFTVTEPRIDITNPGDQGVGTTFTISGTTNLAVGDQIIVEVASSSFEAIEKTSTSITDGVSVTTK
ncbi:MAG TPA: hypothetical protein O0W98_02050, partial [Methanocorpusculum sp.]|nr:hypothetical protein [Methanocorpusculum sp.]